MIIISANTIYMAMKNFSLFKELYSRRNPESPPRRIDSNPSRRIKGTRDAARTSQEKFFVRWVAKKESIAYRRTTPW
jgi:hypothetical protein